MNLALEYREPPSAVAYMLRGALPIARRQTLAPFLSARWSSHRPDRRHLETFLELTGAPPSTHLPLLYPHTIGFRLAMALLTHPSFPVPIWGVLQTRNHLLGRCPIGVNAALDFEVRVSAGRAVAKGAEYDLHTTVRADGVCSWESLVTFFTRGPFGDASLASPLARSPVVGGASVASWSMRNGAYFRFGALTGDYNGIHGADWYARRFGFRRALFHPPQVLGQCLARVTEPNGAGPLRLDAWLKGPVYHGATVRLHAEPSTGGTAFALFEERAASDSGHEPDRLERPSIVARVARVAPGSRLVDDRGVPVEPERE